MLPPNVDGVGAPETDDATLMTRIQSAGDEAALGELMHRWELPVKAVIGRIVLNTSEAEELAQETFVRLWQHRAKFDPARAVKPWILGIAVNLARNRLRWWKRRPSVSLEEWTEPLTLEDTHRPLAGTLALERSEMAQAVQAAIAALPPKLREALILFTYERLSYAEIATIVGASPKAVETRIARARAQLAESLRSQRVR